MREVCVTGQLPGERAPCYGPFWAVPSWVSSDPSLSPFSVPSGEGGCGGSIKWLTLCTRQGRVSLWGASQAWGSQREKSDFKIPQKSQHPEGGNRDTLSELDSLWVSAVWLYQGAHHCISLRPIRSATATSTLLNQKIEGILLFLLIQVPLTGLRFFSYRNWIFPKLQIRRPWLLVSPTSNTAKGYPKIKYCHLSPLTSRLPESRFSTWRPSVVQISFPQQLCQ